MFWFLSYRYEMKPHAMSEMNVDPSRSSAFANVVLARIHPLVWLSMPAEDFRKYYIQHALFFCEIDETTFEEVRRLNYIAFLDYREKGQG